MSREKGKKMSDNSNPMNVKLSTVISRKMNMLPVLAKKWQWRILNEYPEDIKNLIFKWANDEPLPEIAYNEISLKDIMNGTGLDVLEAADLLYIISKDPVQGYEIFSRSIRRCRRM